MREVPTTEAKSRFAELLRVVEYGESIAITRHGKTVAHLVPAVDQERALQEAAVERFRAWRQRRPRTGMTREEILAARREVNQVRPRRVSKSPDIRWRGDFRSAPSSRS